MNLVKIYSKYIAILPILSIYSSGIPGISIGELGLIIFLVITFLMDITKHKPINRSDNLVFVVLLGYIIFSANFTILFQKNSEILVVLIRIIRFSFYVICATWVSKYFFDFNIASKTVKKIGLYATFYIFIQNVAYYGFNIFLKGFLSFIPLYTEHYATQDYIRMYQTHFYRPTSFFLEPAGFSQYSLLALCLVLFASKQENLNIKNLTPAILITAGIVLSTSAQGILLAIIIWLFFIYKARKLFRNGKMIVSIISILILAVSIPLYRVDLVQRSLGRIAISSETGAFTARFSGYNAFINEVPNSLKLIGLGYGRIPSDVWMSSAPYVLYGAGIIGFLLVTYIFVRLYFRTKSPIEKIVNLIFFALFFGAATFNSYMFVYYFSFILYSANYENGKK